MAKRFKVGDLARYVVGVGIRDRMLGMIFEIVRVGPVNGLLRGNNVIFDYVIDSDELMFPGGCYDWQLQPLNPPAEPLSLTRQEECET